MTILRTIYDATLESKVVLLRVDLNVPMSNGKVTDSTRIKRILPTIEYLISRGAKIVIASHFDRPNGRMIDKMSLSHIKHHIEMVLKQSIEFVDECVGQRVRDAIKSLKDCQILLLENLRFHKGEENNDSDFAKQLSEGIDIYINDAFACSHREHASIVGITKYIPSYAGLLIKQENENLDIILSSKAANVLAIIGGKKVSTKFKVLANLAKSVSNIVIAGAMANTFIKALGYDIGQSYFEENLTTQAAQFINQNHHADIFLPSDFTVLNNESNLVRVVERQNIENDTIYDLGTSSVTQICRLLDNTSIVLWNGPVGLFEDDRFSAATVFIARHIAKLTRLGKIKSIIGGGDTIYALEKAGVGDSISYISTAGGAFLEYLESGSLLGIDVLKNNLIHVLP